jgi:hypothetical protein
VTADAAHVAAVADALMNAPAPSLGPFLAPIAATVAVETLTPLIRAQVAAEIIAYRDSEPALCREDEAYDLGLGAAAIVAEGGTP